MNTHSVKIKQTPSVYVFPQATCEKCCVVNKTDHPRPKVLRIPSTGIRSNLESRYTFALKHFLFVLLIVTLIDAGQL